MAAIAKKRKLQEENRIFQESWEEEFLFIKGKRDGMAICLLCNESVVALKKYNMARHHSTKHNNFNESFPIGSSIRKDKIASLKKCVQAQRNALLFSVNQSEAATKASYEVSFLLAKKMKPFTDGELMKDCITRACETLFTNFANKRQIMTEIKKLQLSDSTCARRSEVMANDLFKTLLTEIKNCKYFSLALDSSTDISSTAQLSMYVRYCMPSGDVYEDFLGLVPMKGQTRGSDFLLIINNFFTTHSIPWGKLICVCTDGCPSMIGVNNGFVSLLKAQLNKPSLLHYHCIIHQENLASKIGNKSLIDIMKKVVNIVNFIRARELNHRLFQELLAELDAQYGDVLFHTEVRWLSKGKVLERFFNLRHEIQLFLNERGQNHPELDSAEWWMQLAFLTDITCKLNELQISLQGENKIITHMSNKVFAFQEKLQLYETELKDNDLMNFPFLMEFKLENTTTVICFEKLSHYVCELRMEMEKRFSNLKSTRGGLGLIEHPWQMTQEDVKELVVFGFNRGLLMNEFIDLKNDSELKAMFESKLEKKEYGDFWKQIPHDKFPTITQCAHLILTLFCSTYLCETSFSKMKIIKNVYRSRLTDEHVNQLMCISLSKKTPNIDKIISCTKQFHKSN